MPSDRALIASRVRGELAMVNISGRKLAELLGWPVDGTLRRLRGEVPFRAEEMLAVARVLDVPASRFLPPEPIDATPAAS